MNYDQIKALCDLMVANDLTELMLRDGEDRIVLRRATPGALAPAVAAAAPVQTMLMPAHVAAQAAPAPVVAAPAPGALIKSPMVGTFYAAADPESPPYVSVGSRVGPETVVCKIEAMKVFNEIKAEVSGAVEAVLVSNAQPVEFGQPLFRVKPD
ncbi:MAG: acetyl-CoA carboxylase biotin carboxyl carrier protein [Phycisphaerae bacterium]